MIDQAQRRSRAIACLALAVGLFLLGQEGLARGQLAGWGGVLSGVGVALGVYGLARLSIAPATPPRWLEFLALGGVMLVAAFFRLHQLATLPEGLWYDEAQNGLVAQRILREPSYRPVFVATPSQLPALFFYLLALSLQWLGDSALALRLVPSALGLLTVPSLYLLARLMFGVPVALVAAFLLAVSLWHVNFSRFAMNGILTPLLEILALYFLFRGLRSRRAADFLAAGAALGLGFHAYYASYAVIVVVLGLWLHQALMGDGPAARGYWRGLLLVLVAAALVAAPLAAQAWRDPAGFGARLEAASLFRSKTPSESLVALRDNAVKHALMFNYQGDRNGRHNLPGRPMLDQVTAAFFLLGLAYSGWRWRQPEYGFVAWWLIVMLLPGVLSLEWEAPQAYRSIGALPPAVLLASIGLCRSGGALANYMGRRPGATLTLLILLALAVVGGLNYASFFHRKAQDFASWAAYSATETAIARFIRQHGEESEVYLSPVFQGHPTIKFLAPGLRASRTFSLVEDVPATRAQAQPALYALEPAMAFVIPILQRAYPRGAFREEKSPWGQTIFISGVLTPAEVAEARGLEVRYYEGLEAVGPPAVVRREAAIDLDFGVQSPLPFPFVAEGLGRLHAARYGPYRLTLEAPGWAQVVLDGQGVLEGEGGKLQGEATLARGLHTLRWQARIERPGRLRLLWAPPGGREEVVPSRALYLPQVPANGLLGSYFRGPDWAGRPALRQIDPAVSFYFHILPLPRPFSAEWRGQIDIPVRGLYRFGTHSIDYSWLYLDGKLVVDNGQRTNRYEEAEVWLEGGRHDIVLRYLNRSDFAQVYLYWTPPGGRREIVPAAQLYPAENALELGK